MLYREAEKLSQASLLSQTNHGAGIFIYLHLVDCLMVNVGRYTILGSYEYEYMGSSLDYKT